MRNSWRSEHDELKQHSVDRQLIWFGQITDLNKDRTEAIESKTFRTNRISAIFFFPPFPFAQLLIPRRQYLRCILWIPALLRKDEARLSMAFLFLGYALNRGRVEKTSFTLLLLESCHGIDQQNSGMILPFERTSSVSLSLME